MFGLIMFLMIGFGFAFQILAPNFQLEHTDGPFYALRDAQAYIDFSAGSSLWQSFFAIFGSFDVAELAGSPGAAVAAPGLLYVFLFFVSMPIINLLIAMFSESYAAMAKMGATASLLCSPLLWKDSRLAKWAERHRCLAFILLARHTRAEGSRTRASLERARRPSTPRPTRPLGAAPRSRD